VDQLDPPESPDLQDLMELQDLLDVKDTMDVTEETEEREELEMPEETETPDKASTTEVPQAPLEPQEPQEEMLPAQLDPRDLLDREEVTEDPELLDHLDPQERRESVEIQVLQDPLLPLEEVLQEPQETLEEKEPLLTLSTLRPTPSPSILRPRRPPVVRRLDLPAMKSISEMPLRLTEGTLHSSWIPLPELELVRDSHSEDLVSESSVLLPSWSAQKMLVISVVTTPLSGCQSTTEREPSRRLSLISTQPERSLPTLMVPRTGTLRS